MKFLEIARGAAPVPAHFSAAARTSVCRRPTNCEVATPARRRTNLKHKTIQSYHNSASLGSIGAGAPCAVRVNSCPRMRHSIAFRNKQLWTKASRALQSNRRSRLHFQRLGMSVAAQPEGLFVPELGDEQIVVLERLQQNALKTGSQRGMNVVAFGGGVAATLVLYLVHAVFEGRCVAVFVRLPGTTDEDWQRAQYLASFVGIEIWQLPAAEEATAGEEWDVPSPALRGALAAIRGMLAANRGMPAVVYDGMHADDLLDHDLPLNAQGSVAHVEGWEGSEDSGEAVGTSYAAVSEAADRDIDIQSASHALQGLPDARRVSLLTGMPEMAVRLVAEVAGMPNWDWVPIPEDAVLEDILGEEGQEQSAEEQPRLAEDAVMNLQPYGHHDTE
mmetsp:Transcript_5535/g.15878  ORF Transcript_5535/g.15878 Transcript_5535/m.15878 type:complete len:389 (+) Transcript_5535:258-1424(+)